MEGNFTVIDFVGLVIFIMWCHLLLNKLSKVMEYILFSWLLCSCWCCIYFYDAWIYPVVYKICENRNLYFDSNWRLIDKFCDWVTSNKTHYFRYESPLRLFISIFIPMCILSFALPLSNGFIGVLCSCILCAVTYCVGMYNRYRFDEEELNRVIGHNKNFLNLYFLTPNVGIVLGGFIFTLLGINLWSESVTNIITLSAIEVNILLHDGILGFLIILLLVIILVVGVIISMALPFWTLVFAGVDFLSYYIKYGTVHDEEVSFKSFWDKLF